MFVIVIEPSGIAPESLTVPTMMTWHWPAQTPACHEVAALTGSLREATSLLTMGSALSWDTVGWEEEPRTQVTNSLMNFPLLFVKDFFPFHHTAVCLCDPSALLAEMCITSLRQWYRVWYTNILQWQCRFDLILLLAQNTVAPLFACPKPSYDTSYQVLISQVTCSPDNNSAIIVLWLECLAEWLLCNIRAIL